MHEYLRAVGFSRIESKEQLNQLLNMTEESYQTERTAVSANGNDFSERKKEFAPRMGIMLRGEYDEKGDYQRDYYFPYFMGTQEKFYDNISIERHAEKESYAGVCEDLSMGVTIIFYLQNAGEYLTQRNRGHYSGGVHSLTLSGLARKGTILLPVLKKQENKEEEEEKSINRGRLMAAAKNGDEEAMESLTIEDMDTYSMISKRVENEDVYSIVDSYFMPYGMECDLYNIMGEILECSKVQNVLTGDIIYEMRICCNDIELDVCVNESDLLGEPMKGRRFKGVVWLQGYVDFEY